MDAFTRPACLFDMQTDTVAGGLVRVSCRYAADTFRSDSFALAGITPPASLSNAIAKRQTEYLAGRWCARAALATLGFTGVPSLNADRSPCWPEGTIGSISHSHGQAEALVADSRQWLTVGVDIEQWMTTDTAHRVAPTLLTEQELAHWQALPASQQATQLTRIFSAKESLFKALYPLTQTRFYFQDANSGESNEQTHLTLLRTLSAQWPQGSMVPFQWQDNEQSVRTWIALAAAE